MIPFYIWAKAVQVLTIVMAEGELLMPPPLPITTTTAIRHYRNTPFHPHWEIW
jgi:hypothetical protein